jgi:hypothetical protein
MINCENTIGIAKASHKVPDSIIATNDDSREGYGAGEVGGGFIVAGGGAAPVLQSAEHGFDQVAQLVGCGSNG